MVRSTQSSVKRLSTTAQAVATTGLRRNFQPLKPSTGASFHAPPTAVSQPPSPATSTRLQSGSGDTACWIARAAHQTSSMPIAIIAPMAWRRPGSSIGRPCTARRIGIE